MAKIGVPDTWPEQWDFIAAISACFSETQCAVRFFKTRCYLSICLLPSASQMVWIAMFLALEEHGIDCEPHERSKADAMQRTIYFESLEWSLRIADLTQMLLSHGYLRLDPNMMRSGLQYVGQ